MTKSIERQQGDPLPFLSLLSAFSYNTAMQKEKQITFRECVSNSNKEVYSISRLPEEWIAVVLAKVSRSPKSFRVHLKRFLEDMQKTGKQVAAFHEKWVLQYGHASVAEHANLHCGLEHISRHLSELLELTVKRGAFTEYSQRYQKPQPKAYIIPAELKKSSKLSKRYCAFQDRLFELYLEAEQKLTDFHFKKLHGKNKEAKLSCEKRAFEDARYLLSRATWTNLGMTLNGRDAEELISYLLSLKDDAEARRCGQHLRREAKFALPTLVKYAEAKTLPRRLHTLQQKWGEKQSISSSAIVLKPEAVVLDAEPEEEALTKLLATFIYPTAKGSWSKAVKETMRWTKTKRRKRFAQIVKALSIHDRAPESFEAITYAVEFRISESCWHQLLRHRPPSWHPKKACLHYGFLLPQAAQEAGIEKLFREAKERAEEMAKALTKLGFPHIAHYAVLNGHLRFIVGYLTLRELFYLLALRTSPAAQWEIQQACFCLLKDIQRFHPAIAAPLQNYLAGFHG